MFNRQPRTIALLQQKFLATGSVADRHRLPRRRVTTLQQDRHIILSHLRVRRQMASETARNTIGIFQRPISDRTVRRRLRERGLRCRRPKVGIVLTHRHRALRLRWARRHLRMTRVDWGNVIFADESRFKVSGNDGRQRIYRRIGERFAECCVNQRNWYGNGSVMVWAGISLHTKTDLVIVNGNLNAAQFQNQVLRPHLIPHMQANRPMTLAHDNAPCHTARTTRQILRNNNVQVMDWPPCSPDLNPIEHVWDELGRRVRSLRQQQNVQQLSNDLLQVWNAIPQRFLFNFINSMRARCLAVIRSNGGHTKY